MSQNYSGSCLCQTVKFEIIGDFEQFFLCHCQYCQKDTGSAHAANLFSTKATLSWIRGRNFVSTFNVPNTKHVKSFCQCCGSALPFLQFEGKLLVVPAGSLDVEFMLKPQAHLFCDSRASWDDGFQDVKMCPTYPTITAPL